MPGINSVSPAVHAVQSSSPAPATYEVLWTVQKDTLPEALPTPDEIEAATNIIKQGRGRCVSRVGRRYVVKFGSQVDRIEGENMHWVRENAREVPVPKVFAIYQREVTPHTKITYIIMEDVGGQPLDALWDSLDLEQRKDVVIQIRQAVTHLRATNNMGDFGAYDASELRDDIFWTDDPDTQYRGRFTNETAFTQAVIDKYMTSCGNSDPHRAQYYRRVLPTVLQGTGRPFFTHNDLRRENIMVRDNGDIAIKGWATAGWFPTYWEYASAMHVCDFTDDWHEYLGKILNQEYPNQSKWISKLRTDLQSQRFAK
ncbi:hypothetical protein CEP52_012321 [Fusarium oligoseptatum]|uniref:Aminoglycoside phosphotransferase domain-containing protein n=3 Tax=Fusarium solani species complex TaxID=232080 RepID=A0A428SYU1_9HYPO|nr:hypothetical protein CEP51_014112 [Fusarium floridanum]RSL94962.1 hypothetical protein CEP52_012321 [Fusarium oligoseptatum]RSL95049.1 hypothetical protein CDV31_014063 [Fusarium ambrosium]